MSVTGLGALMVRAEDQTTNATIGESVTIGESFEGVTEQAAPMIMQAAVKNKRTETINCYKMEDSTDMMATEGWKWDRPNSVLTLNGVELSVAGGAAIYMPGGTIEIATGSENTISNTGTISSCVAASGAITILGGGVLNIDAKSAISTTMASSITIAGGRLNLNGEISNSNAEIIFNGGTVNIDTTGSYGIRNNCHKVRINGGSLSVKAANAAIVGLDGGSIDVKTGMTVTNDLKVQAAGKYKSFAENGKTLGYGENGFTNAAKEVIIKDSTGGLPEEVYAVEVKSEPTKTKYLTGETLDLTGFVVSMKKSDGDSEDVGFADFATKGIQTTPKHGDTLSPINHDITIWLNSIRTTQRIEVSDKTSGGDKPVVPPVEEDKPILPPANNGDNNIIVPPVNNNNVDNNPVTNNDREERPTRNPDNVAQTPAATGKTDSATTPKPAEPKAVSAVFEKAAKAAEASGATKVVMNLKNVSTISPEILKSVAAETAKSGKAALITVDTMNANGKSIDARIYIDPSKATLTTGLSLGIKLENKTVEAQIAKNYQNTVRVVEFTQKGGFGMPITAAVKLNLSGLNSKALKFFTYDKATNTTKEIASTNYRIDKAGYLYFTTAVGGSILVTDSALISK